MPFLTNRYLFIYAENYLFFSQKISTKTANLLKMWQSNKDVSKIIWKMSNALKIVENVVNFLRSDENDGAHGKNIVDVAEMTNLLKM